MVCTVTQLVVKLYLAERITLGYIADHMHTTVIKRQWGFVVTVVKYAFCMPGSSSQRFVLVPYNSTVLTPYYQWCVLNFE